MYAPPATHLLRYFISFILNQAVTAIASTEIQTERTQNNADN